MCTGLEPLLIASVAGAGLSAVGQVSQARTQSALLQREAELGRREAAFEEAGLRKQADELKGRQRVAVAKAGVAPTGSVLEVMRQSAEEVELEALNIQFGAEAGAQARLFEAEQIRKAAPLQAAGTLLTGFGQIA